MTKPTEISDKQRAFVSEYLIDFNATQAAVRAGYSERTARQQGQRLLSKVVIQRAVNAAVTERIERVEISRDYVLSSLLRNAERAMQAEPVRDREGNPTGVYVYRGSVANRALELLGKHLGLFSDKIEHTGAGGGPIRSEASPDAGETRGGVTAEARRKGFEDLFARLDAYRVGVDDSKANDSFGEADKPNRKDR